ncbi:MAG: hypothetical protein EOP60_16350 [Sphingomonadales bacterium]|nr:MAG: hypothetical protein EOP60_16350 [Sphingomonadales bacterium]
MKFVVLAAAAFACLTPAAAFAQDAPAAPADAAAEAPAAAAAKFNLDTPIETLVADPAANAVLTANLEGPVTSNPNYEAFKGMSLTAVAPYAPDKLPADKLKKIETELAAIK